jgi:hypothetical protein
MKKSKQPIPVNEKFPIEEAREFFAALFYGEHHITSEIKPIGRGWSITTHGDISTYDFNGMTRLVLLAHDRCIRASIDTAGMKLRIRIHKRHTREGDMTERHPTIEEAITTIRASNYYNQGIL